MNTQFSRRRAWLMAGSATGLALAFAVAGSAQAQTTAAALASDDSKVEESSSPASVAASKAPSR
jgi:iron complex outermembrane receptor protein